MQDLWMQIKSAYREQPRDVLTFGRDFGNFDKGIYKP